MASGTLTTSQLLYFLSVIKQMLLSNYWIFNFPFPFKEQTGFHYEITEGTFNEFNIEVQISDN